MKDLESKNYHIPGLNLKQGFEGSSVSVYFHFVRNFYHHGAQYIDELETVLSTSNLVTIRNKVHGLRGVAAALGAFKLEQACSELTQALDSHPTMPMELVGNIFHALNSLLSGIRDSGILMDIEAVDAVDIDQESSILNSVNLLIIEDEVIFSQMIQEFFSNHCNHIAAFSQFTGNAHKILEITKNTPLICIIDYNLPRTNGLEIAKEIHKVNQDAYKLLISGEEIPYQNYKEMKNCMALLKPFNLNDLKNLLEGIALNMLSKNNN